MKRHLATLLLALPLLLGAYTATAQEVKVPNSDWTVTPSSPTSGENVTIQYTGNQYVKDEKLTPLPTKVTITPACMTLLVGESVTLKADIYPNLTGVNKSVIWESDDPTVLSIDENGKITANAEGTAKITVKTVKNEKTAELDIAVKAIPTDCIPGTFSVGTCKKVIFSKGNLQYQPSSSTWRFAEHQYDLLDDDPTYNHTTSSYTSISDDWIDLFGWGTWTVNGADPWETTFLSPKYETGVSGAGEFENVCKEGIGDGKWMTLSSIEWGYLLYGRTTAMTIRFSKATVHDVNGLVLMPDNWEGTYVFANSNTYDAAFAEISNGDWTTLEAEGAVFLPAAGQREETSVRGVGSNGKYWSSTARNDLSNAKGTWSYFVGFGTGDVSSSVIEHRFEGLSVRLVHCL